MEINPIDITQTQKRSNVMSIYTRDKDLFEKTAQEVITLWYIEFGETLAKSEMLQKSMMIMQQYLKGNLVAVDNKKTVTQSLGRISS